MNHAKPEWNALLICQIVFAAIGCVFTALALALGGMIEELAASPYSRGNVYILPWVFGAIGISFLLVFGILFAVWLKRMRTRARLIESGTRIHARVTAIRQDPAVRINNRHPNYVLCQAPDPRTGEMLTFRSPNTLADPAHLSGQYLQVYLDPENPRKYYVELR